MTSPDTAETRIAVVTGAAGSIGKAVATRLGLSDADKVELLPSGQQPAFKNRNGWAHDRLKRAAAVRG